jgi:hypothetical protein
MEVKGLRQPMTGAESWGTSEHNQLADPGGLDRSGGTMPPRLLFLRLRSLYILVMQGVALVKGLYDTK